MLTAYNKKPISNEATLNEQLEKIHHERIEWKMPQRQGKKSKGAKQQKNVSWLKFGTHLDQRKAELNEKSQGWVHLLEILYTLGISMV